MKKRLPVNERTHYCRECRHATPVDRFHTLDMQGRPTLAECPFVRNRRVLLSEKACKTHFIAI